MLMATLKVFFSIMVESSKGMTALSETTSQPFLESLSGKHQINEISFRVVNVANRLEWSKKVNF